MTLIVRSCSAEVKLKLPSLKAASVVWCGRPVNTWTAGVPPQCRHTFPRYPGLNCTPAMIPLGSLARPKDKDRGDKKEKMNAGTKGERGCGTIAQKRNPNNKR